MGKKLLPILFATLVFGGAWSSCRYNPVVTHPPCDTCNKPCDTCNLNQDSLQRIKDSLAHAFTWQQFSVPGESSITGCWVFGPNDIYVNGTNLYHFDGTNFTKMDAIRNSNGTHIGFADNNLFALSKTDFWLISTGALYHTIDGKYFDDFRPSGYFNNGWGTSSNDMFFVGNGGNIYHYDGSKFDTMKSGTTVDLKSIWGVDDNHIWACGTHHTSGITSILFYDGSTWSVDPLSNTDSANTSGLYSIWTSDSAVTHENVLAAGGYLFRKKDNDIWKRDYSVPNKMPDNTPIIIGYLTGNQSTDFFSGGWYGWSSHWNGKSWSLPYKDIFEPNNSSYETLAMSSKGNTVCLVGDKNGNSWVAVGTRKK